MHLTDRHTSRYIQACKRLRIFKMQCKRCDRRHLVFYRGSIDELPCLYTIDAPWGDHPYNFKTASGKRWITDTTTWQSFSLS